MKRGRHPAPFDKSRLPYRLLACSNAPGGTDSTVHYESDHEDLLLNRMEVEVYDLDWWNLTGPVGSHTFDYNLRTGFDPISETALDTQDPNFPYVEPQSFGSNPTFQTRLVVPATWLDGLPGSGHYEARVEFTDIWGYTLTCRFEYQ